MITATRHEPSLHFPDQSPLCVGSSLSREVFAAIRRALVLDHCKWDPQVEDRSTLAPFPLIMSAACWTRLAKDAEQLAAETVRAEEYLLTAPSMWPTIGVPRKLCRVLAQISRLGPTPAATRVMRFDFHWTTSGWRVSEVNSDVPGGYCESSSFTRFIAGHFPEFHPAGDPAQTWIDAMTRRQSGLIALLCAPGFMEDQQVVSYLAMRLREQGCETILAEPGQLRWQNGFAYLIGARLGAIVRFYQAEWLCHLPRRSGWMNFIAGGRTPVTNPGAAILSESKRFPLIWPHLPFEPSTWRRLLPETRDPRQAPWQTDDSWIIKSAYCNTGDTVTIRGVADSKRWRSALRAARWHPGMWLAQKRFETVPLSSPIGPIYPCIGIYVIDGIAAGAYARVSTTPVIDYSALDIALLLKPESADE